jgi:hypothetical protein
VYDDDNAVVEMLSGMAVYIICFKINQAARELSRAAYYACMMSFVHLSAVLPAIKAAAAIAGGSATVLSGITANDCTKDIINVCKCHSTYHVWIFDICC